MKAEDEWDFYLCVVDDAHASIFLNLWFDSRAPVSGADTLYWLRIQMREQAEHGLGSAAEAELLYPVEHQLTARAEASGFLHVGRLRCDGRWQVIFYGPADRLEAMQTLADGLEGRDGREVETGSQPDPGWDYYREFLLPDRERRQWMRDGRVVEALQAKGDPLQPPRRVDHWIYFATANTRDAFVRDVASEGFVIEEASGDAAGQLAFGARVHRVDPVVLDHIHEVVMNLIAVADRHEGTYDGWETSVVQAPS